jgi:hypothetical protein
MFPVLVYVYVRLARKEDALMEAEFSECYRAYAARTPAFMPRLSGTTTTQSCALRIIGNWSPNRDSQS